MEGYLLRILGFCLLPLFSIIGSIENEVEFSGKLVKKYYKTSSIIHDLSFGWFLELDVSSKNRLNMSISSFDANEKQLCSHFDTSIIQLMLNSGIASSNYHDLENQLVYIKGQLWYPPHLYRPIPSHQLTVYALEDKSLETSKRSSMEEKSVDFQELFVLEKERIGQPHKVDTQKLEDILLELPEGSSPSLITLCGFLQLKLYPGPPNYESIENGDYPESCWMLQMDSRSFDIVSHTRVLEPALSMADIMSTTNPLEIQLGLESNMRKFCENHINQKVTIQGYLSHAILAHHHAPFLMKVYSIDEDGKISVDSNQNKEYSSRAVMK